MTGPLSVAGDLAAYEAGELGEDAVIDLFQCLVDTGMLHHLQGSYGRTAQAMLDAGIIAWPES